MPRATGPFRAQPAHQDVITEKDDYVPMSVRDVFLLDEDEDR